MSAISTISPDSVHAAPPRFIDADAATFLDQVAGTDLLARGCVNLIGLDAIRDRLADRWPRKREEVWAYAERCLASHMSTEALYKRVNETDYLVAVVADTALAAQAMTLHALADILARYMGDYASTDLTIRSVVGVRGDELDCIPLDPGAMQRPDVRMVAQPPVQSNSEPADRWAEPMPFFFTSESGRELRVTHELHSIVCLRRGGVMAVRCEPMVTDRGSGKRIPVFGFLELSDSDLAAIDSATREFCLPLGKRALGKRSIIMPQSFQTLSSSRGRSALMAMMSPDDFRKTFCLQLVGLDAGTPSSRLTEIVGLLHTFCDAIFARVTLDMVELRSIRDAKFQAILLDAESLGGGVAAIERGMRIFGERMQGAAPMLGVSGLPSMELLNAATSAKLTHAGIRDRALL